jgi:hypothetical protein
VGDPVTKDYHTGLLGDLPFYHPEPLPIFSFAGRTKKNMPKQRAVCRFFNYLCSRNPKRRTAS